MQCRHRDGTQHLAIVGRVAAEELKCIFVKRGEKAGVSRTIAERVKAAQGQKREYRAPCGCTLGPRTVHSQRAEWPCHPGCGPTRKKSRLRLCSAGPQPMCLFPEATTTNGRYLLPFKTGAFVPGVPVKPLVLEYTWGARQMSPAWESFPAHWHIFLLLCSWCYRVRVLELPTYTPSEAERADPALFAANVRRVMLEACPLLAPGEATFEDKKVFHAALLKMLRHPGGRAAMDRSFRSDGGSWTRSGESIGLLDGAPGLRPRSDETEALEVRLGRSVRCCCPGAQLTRALVL